MSAVKNRKSFPIVDKYELFYIFVIMYRFRNGE